MFQQILQTICRQGVQEVLIELHLENFEAAFQQRDIRSLQDPHDWQLKRQVLWGQKNDFNRKNMVHHSGNCFYFILIVDI